jgi:L-ribulose-5-phosphate 3-epimerase
MVTDDDPAAAVIKLKDYIAHTHAKDGKILKKKQPEKICKYFAEDGIEDIKLEEYFIEMPSGEGAVYFDENLAALNKIGYKGFLTIERAVGNNQEKDIRLAVEF